MSFTAREIARQKKQARRERERDLVKKDREALRRLRAHLKHARKYKKERRREIVKLCRRARADNRERAKAIRAQHRADAADEIGQRRAEARNACEAEKGKLNEKVQGSIARAAAALQAERQHQRTLRIWANPDPLGRKGGRAAAGRARAEARSESDSDVIHNLPPELVPVFEAVKSQIKEGPRRTRTEAFLEWVAENGADVEGIMYRTIDADVQRLIAAEAELRERDPGHWRGLSDEDLEISHRTYDMPQEAVPF